MELGRKVRGIVIPLTRRTNKRMFERRWRREPARHSAEQYLVFMDFSSDRLMLLKKTVHVIEARKYI